MNSAGPNRSNLVNHRFSYNNTQMFIKADNGTRLYIWPSTGGDHWVKDKPLNTIEK